MIWLQKIKNKSLFHVFSSFSTLSASRSIVNECQMSIHSQKNYNTRMKHETLSLGMMKSPTSVART